MKVYSQKKKPRYRDESFNYKIHNLFRRHT